MSFFALRQRAPTPVPRVFFPMLGLFAVVSSDPSLEYCVASSTARPSTHEELKEAIEVANGKRKGKRAIRGLVLSSKREKRALEEVGR